MKLTITINLENAAFEDNEGTECARILTDLASRIDDMTNLDGASENLRDINGNNVGKAVVK